MVSVRLIVVGDRYTPHLSLHRNPWRVVTPPSRTGQDRRSKVCAESEGAYRILVVEDWHETSI